MMQPLLGAIVITWHGKSSVSVGFHAATNGENSIMSAKPSILKKAYGTTAAGVAVDEYTLTNASGIEVKIITYGGIITSIRVPDRNGSMTNVALGFDNLSEYETKNSPYFGAII